MQFKLGEYFKILCDGFNADFKEGEFLIVTVDSQQEALSFVFDHAAADRGVLIGEFNGDEVRIPLLQVVDIRRTQ